MLLRNKWSFGIFIKEACSPGWDCMLSVTEPFFLMLHLNVHMRILLSLCLCAVLLWTKCLILKSTVTGLVPAKFVMWEAYFIAESKYRTYSQSREVDIVVIVNTLVCCTLALSLL